MFETSVGESVYESGVTFSFLTACPSTVPAGTWTSNVGSPPYVVTITDNGAGSYSIDNFNLDYDVDFYNSFDNLSIGGGFTDVCNTINLGVAAELGLPGQQREYMIQ